MRANAHDTDLPEWVRNSTSCTIDLLAAPNALEGEIDFSQKDALAVLGQKKWVKAKTPRLMAEKIKAGLFIDGRPPDWVEPAEATEMFEHWRVRWNGAMPRSFDVRVELFKDMGVPGWCRIFVVPVIGDKPEQSFFFKSDQAFHFPQIPVMPDGTWFHFLGLGFFHIMPGGLDHILFVLGLCLVSQRFGALLVQITAFTVAHTITLGLAAKGILSLHSQIVEPLIAASLVLVAWENLSRKGPSPRRWLVVFAFGLVHGLGFAGALRNTGLPPDAFLSSLFAFNLGVEAGQLTVVGMAVALLWRLRGKNWYRKKILAPASWGIGAAGLFWVFERLIT
jgi:hypothetical protein